MQWEYTVMTRDMNQNLLNQLGGSGWELVSLVRANEAGAQVPQFTMVFKKPREHRMAA
jgi:hypothetical protein